MGGGRPRREPGTLPFTRRRGGRVDARARGWPEICRYIEGKSYG
jgi:hypothetical protein